MGAVLMPTMLVLMRTPTGALAPCDTAAAEFIASLKVGQGLRGHFVRERNPAFHRKAFALFKLAFDTWEAPDLQYQGQPVGKEFNRFRKDLTVLAGHYQAVTNLKGEVRLEAKSLAFGAMDEDEFSEVYRDLLNVVWKHVLARAGYASAADVDRVVNELMRFE